MLNIGPAELVVVLVVALIVLGPNRLPDAARSVGKALSELRRATAGLQAEVRDAFEPPPSFTPPVPPEVVSEPPLVPPPAASAGSAAGGDGSDGSDGAVGTEVERRPGA